MNKSELIAFVSQKSGLTTAESSKAVEAVFGAVKDALSKEDEVRLVGFGTFSVGKREAREGRNPRTGETIKIAATKVARFKPGKELKEAVQ